MITKLTEVINNNSKHKEISFPTPQKNLTNYCNQRGRENVFTFNDFNIDGSTGNLLNTVIINRFKMLVIKSLACLFKTDLMDFIMMIRLLKKIIMIHMVNRSKTAQHIETHLIIILKATSSVYVNNFPEKNILPLNNYNQCNKYEEKKGRKIAILSDSNTKPIDMIELNHCLVNGHIVKRAHGGATASRLSYYAHATLNEDKPDTIIVSAGTNNLSKRWW